MDNAFRYIRDNGGIDTEAGYPYLGRQQPYCYFQREYVGATVTGNITITVHVLEITFCFQKRCFS